MVNCNFFIHQSIQNPFSKSHFFVVFISNYSKSRNKKPYFWAKNWTRITWQPLSVKGPVCCSGSHCFSCSISSCAPILWISRVVPLNLLRLSDIQLWLSWLIVDICEWDRSRGCIRLRTIDIWRAIGIVMTTRRARAAATRSQPSQPLKPTAPALFCSEAPPPLVVATVAPLAFVILSLGFLFLSLFFCFWTDQLLKCCACVCCFRVGWSDEFYSFLRCAH